MAMKKFYGMICCKEVLIDVDEFKDWLIEIIPDRIWGLKVGNPFHSCEHESVFESNDVAIADFLCLPEDEEARQISEIEMKDWKGKIKFHSLEEGIEDVAYFGKVMQTLLDEIRFINRSSIENKKEKIKLVVKEKLEGYKEIIK